MHRASPPPATGKAPVHRQEDESAPDNGPTAELPTVPAAPDRPAAGTGPDRAEPDRAELDRTAPDRAKPAKAAPAKAGAGRKAAGATAAPKPKDGKDPRSTVAAPPATPTVAQINPPQ